MSKVKATSLAILLAALALLITFRLKSPSPKLARSDHFNGKVFHNLNEPPLAKSLKDFLKWRFQDQRDGWPEWIDVAQKVPPKKSESSITFINHATILIQLDGVNILTDPIYSKRASPLNFMGPKRVKLPGVKFDDLPKIDIILLSHNHYDSFDIKTLNRLTKRDNPRILLGIGNARYLSSESQNNAIEMDWQDKLEFNKLTFTFLPAKHWSKRGLFDTNKALWGAFAITGSRKVYFAGDTGYSEHFRGAREQFRSFDISLIPIGAYEPRWFMKPAHINPEEAVQAHRELNSKKSIGFHFGTFRLTNESIADPVNDLAAALKKYNIPPGDFIAPSEGSSYAIE